MLAIESKGILITRGYWWAEGVGGGLFLLFPPVPMLGITGVCVGTLTAHGTGCQRWSYGVSLQIIIYDDNWDDNHRLPDDNEHLVR